MTTKTDPTSISDTYFIHSENVKFGYIDSNDIILEWLVQFISFFLLLFH